MGIGSPTEKGVGFDGQGPEGRTKNNSSPLSDTSCDVIGTAFAVSGQMSAIASPTPSGGGFVCDETYRSPAKRHGHVDWLAKESGIPGPLAETRGKLHPPVLFTLSTEDILINALQRSVRQAASGTKAWHRSLE